ncbi:hypothetical protein [Aminomonas paucivorans]|uniref:hypothetical protein n=1 Tax=Aminomonas paucivorans TaxID=81412 RepID=UPI003321BF9D
MIATPWGRAQDYWGHWGFEPWEEDPLGGIRRLVTLRKASLLGEVARAFVWDHILWKHQGERSEADLLRETPPSPEVMSQRFLLVGAEEAPRRARSFRFGLRGFVEVLRYRPGGPGHRLFRDLTDLVDGFEGYENRPRNCPSPEAPSLGGGGSC